MTSTIIHGLNIHDCRKGDGVSIFGGSHILVDHCSISNCYDGLIDAIHGSTSITISNNYLTHHNKVMLLGHSELVTPTHKTKTCKTLLLLIILEKGFVQRMPR